MGKPKSVDAKGMHVHGEAALRSFLPFGEALDKTLQIATEVPSLFKLIPALALGAFTGLLFAFAMYQGSGSEVQAVIVFFLLFALIPSVLFCAVKCAYDGRIHVRVCCGQQASSAPPLCIRVRLR